MMVCVTKAGVVEVGVGEVGVVMACVVKEPGMVGERSMVSGLPNQSSNGELMLLCDLRAAGGVR